MMASLYAVMASVYFSAFIKSLPVGSNSYSSPVSHTIKLSISFFSRAIRRHSRPTFNAEDEDSILLTVIKNTNIIGIKPQIRLVGTLGYGFVFYQPSSAHG